MFEIQGYKISPFLIIIPIFIPTIVYFITNIFEENKEKNKFRKLNVITLWQKENMKNILQECNTSDLYKANTQVINKFLDFVEKNEYWDIDSIETIDGKDSIMIISKLLLEKFIQIYNGVKSKENRLKSVFLLDIIDCINGGFSNIYGEFEYINKEIPNEISHKDRDIKLSRMQFLWVNSIQKVLELFDPEIKKIFPKDISFIKIKDYEYEELEFIGSKIGSYDNLFEIPKMEQEAISDCLINDIKSFINSYDKKLPLYRIFSIRALICSIAKVDYETFLENVKGV